MRIALVGNPQKPRALSLAARIAPVLAGRSELVVSDTLGEALGLAAPRSRLAGLKADALVAVGGDGTFLSVLHQSDIPMLAINAGTVGVLAEIDGRDARKVDAALEQLVRGYYFVEARMRLALRAGPEPVPDATNEIVVHSGRVAKMGLFEILLDGRAIGRIQADGIIVATPTGSTGYALSALGPVVEPGVEGIVVVAIAPFRAVSRALVVDPLHTVGVRPVGPGPGAIAVVDGRVEIGIPSDTTVLAYRSPRRARFIRFGSPFLSGLKGKGILPWPEKLDETEARTLADVPPPP